MHTRFLLAATTTVLSLAVAAPALALSAVDRGGRAAPLAYDPDARMTIDASAPTPAQAARLARTGALDLPVTANVPGTISAAGDAAVGDETTLVDGTAPDGSVHHVRVPARFERVVGPVSVTVAQPGSATLPLRLTSAGRARLAAGERITVFLRIGSTAPGGALAMAVPLSIG